MANLLSSTFSLYSICGAHFDGYASNAATTIVVGDGPVTGRKADVILAAWNAFQAAQRKIGEATTNSEVTDVIQAMAEQFQCNAVEGVLSHKVKRHIIDGNDVIINRASPGNNVAEFEFAPGDVIGLDIFVSSGEGKPRGHLAHIQTVARSSRSSSSHYASCD